MVKNGFLGNYRISLNNPVDAHLSYLYENWLRIPGVWGRLFQPLDKFLTPLRNKTFQQLPTILPIFPAVCPDESCDKNMEFFHTCVLTVGQGFQKLGRVGVRTTCLQLRAIIIAIHIRIQESHTSHRQPPSPLSHLTLCPGLHRLRRDPSPQPPNITRTHDPEVLE